MLRNLIYFAIFTSIIVLSVLVFGIYHNGVTSTISKDTNVIISPIPPSFDEKTIKEITGRTIVPADLSQTRGNASASATPVVLPTVPVPTVTTVATTSAAL